MKNILKFKIRKAIEIIREVDDYKISKNMNKIQKLLFYLGRLFKHLNKVIGVFIFHKLYIYYVEIALTTVCTLNCKGCSALMNYYSKKNHFDLDMNINSLKRLIEISDSIEQLRLLGGEPLTYPYLYEILELLNNQDKVKRVTIVTNGTLLFKDNKVLELLKNNKFCIFISNYGIISKNKDKLVNQLENNNIKYILSDEDSYWLDYGNLEYKNRNKNELKKQYSMCKYLCNCILNGQLHHCPRSSHGTNLNIIPLKSNDYVNLLDENLSMKKLRREIYNFYYKYIPYIEACNYCNACTDECKKILPGEQL